jgi:hypothetical protein
MALKIYANVGASDIAREDSGADFLELNLTNDKIIMSAGSVYVADLEPIPTTEQLNSAAIPILSTDNECPYFFVADASENELRQIFNAGNQNKRYVFCAAFDAATASEPILELWDDSTLQTIQDYCLGEGVANDSFFRGITTTSALPGAGWTGKRLAGSSDNHFLFLNDGSGALSVAQDCYFNIRVTIPANFTVASSETPVWVIRYTSN